MNNRFVALVASLGAAFAAGGPPAHAAPSTNPDAAAAQNCVLQGVAEPRINASIEDAQGRTIARFSGSSTELLVSDFPSDSQGRVRVETGTGTGSFRVRGYTRIRELPLHAATRIAVIPGHVWIDAGQSLNFVAKGRGKLRVEKRMNVPFAQTFSAWAPCNALALKSPFPAAESSAQKAPAYSVKRLSLDIYDEPAGTRLLTLRRSAGDASLHFFRKQTRGDWVQVLHSGEIVIDAWVRSRELVPLPRTEALNPHSAELTHRSPTGLAVQGEPRVVRPDMDVPLRAKAKEADVPIGVIEHGTDTYVLDVVSGWASVMPKALNVVPAPDGQFWVKASELGI